MTGAERSRPGLARNRRWITDRAVSDLVKGQACLFGGLVLCLALEPEGWYANHGVSYYGVRWNSFLPYAAGLVGVAAFTRHGLRGLAPATPSPGWTRRVADAFALLVYGVIVTPYTVSGVVDWIHRGFGSALFVLQLVLAIQFVIWTRDVPGLVFLLIQLAGGIAAAVYVSRDQGFLIQAQMLFQAGFGAVMIRTVSVAPRRRTPEGESRRR